MSNILTLPAKQLVPVALSSPQGPPAPGLAWRAALDAVIAEQGAPRVLGAALLSLLKRRDRPRPMHIRHLQDDWLRRDIGLPPMRDRWL